MIPLRDSNPAPTPPVVTLTLIAINVLVFLYEESLGIHLKAFIYTHGLIPFKFVNYDHFPGGIVGNAAWPTLASVFMHGGWMHLIGNMWFLWIFGDNVEDRLGHGKFLLFYLLCGIGASLIHVMAGPSSKIPVIGASGAISGILGAYLICFPFARIHTLVVLWFVEVPSFIFLIIWFLVQLKSGASAQETGVAWWAHIGGFVVGALLILLVPRRKGHRDLSRGYVDGR